MAALFLIRTWLFLLIFTNVRISGLGMIDGLYCGQENCYDLLEVTRDSSKHEVSKAYRKRARKYHPDMYKTQQAKEEAAVMFRQIATAYETLKDEDTRRDYDYMLDHPEEYYAHYVRYYGRRIAPKVDVRIVIVVTISVISIIQYLGAVNNYKTAIAYLLTVPKYRLQAMAIAKSEGLLDDKKKKDRTKTKEELKEEEENVLKMIMQDKMDIRGGYSKPRVVDILWLQLLLSPYYLGCYVVWYVSWVWSYSIRRYEYTDVDRRYIIRRYMKMNQNQWERLEAEEIDDFMTKELWIRSNFDEWKRLKEEEMKIELANNSKYKSYRRYLKKGGPGQMTFAE